MHQLNFPLCGCCYINFSVFLSTELFLQKKFTAVMLIHIECGSKRESNVTSYIEAKIT